MRVTIQDVLDRINPNAIYDLRWETFCYDDAERVIRLVASTRLDIFEMPGNFKPDVYIYGRFTFIKTLYPGEYLATFVQELIVDGATSDSGVQEPMVWNNPPGKDAEFDVERVYSSQRYGFHQRKFPFLIYELPVDVDNDPLLAPYQSVNGQGSPYFPTLQETETYHLFDAFIDNANPSRRMMQIIIDDLRGFFEKIVVSRNTLHITIGGESFQDAEIKVYGKRPGLAAVIQVCGRTEVKIPLETLSTELNVYLSLGEEILDHRVIAERASIYAPTAGVVVERAEPSDIDGILDLRGENQHTEFKSTFSDGVLKTICAFANADGGSIFIGVTDEGEIIGIEDGDKVRLRIEDSIDDLLNGHVVVQYDMHPVPAIDKSKVVLEVRVLAAEVKPIALRERGKSERFYVRRDGTNRIMKRDDFVHLINEQQSSLYSAIDPYSLMK